MVALSIANRQSFRALLAILLGVAVIQQMYSTNRLKQVASGSTDFASTTHFKSRLPSLLLPNNTDATAERRVIEQLANATTSEEHNNPLHNCSITTQVRILRQNSQWFLQSIDAQDKNKRVGGDEFYITYTDNFEGNSSETKATAVALITDRQDGTYLLDFVTTPMNPNPGNLTGAGILTVYFQYSCGIGRMYQPLKDSWQGGGSSMTSFSTESIEPPLRTFQPPRDHGIDLSIFNLTISFGDSLMENLVSKDRKRYRPNLYFETNVNMELSTKTVPELLNKLTRWHKREFINTKKSVALILGSSIWDILQPDNIQGLHFADHLNATRQLVETIQQRFPAVTLFWKAPSTAHPHRIVLEECYREPICGPRVRYLSNSRVEYLHRKQIRLMMDELRVPVLDVFEASYLSADWTFPGDGRHYELAYNKMILNWFYPPDTDP
jgi:GGDEF domain-containing protein